MSIKRADLDPFPPLRGTVAGVDVLENDSVVRRHPWAGGACHRVGA